MSDRARVRGVRRQGCDGRVLRTRPLRDTPYPTVRLCCDQRYQAFTIHTLVAMAWHGPRPDGQECRHLNGDPTDNRPENLAWGTRAENMADMVRHGRGKVARTHCPQGHPYSGGNLLMEYGRRRCRACRRDQRARWWAANGKAVDAQRAGRQRKAVPRAVAD